ncbi:MAG: NADH-quinone oxidoreductase subunit A [bacterium]
MTEYQFGFISVVTCLLVAGLFVFFILLFGRLVRPRRPSPDKRSVYECGERAIGDAWFSFNPRFYIIALIFLIFDVEIAFTYPVALIFSEQVKIGRGMLAYLEVTLFLVVLFLGLVYVWRKGDLNWLKQLDRPAENLDRTEK